MSALDGLAREVRATLMPGFSGHSAPEWVLRALRDGLLSVCVYGGNVRDRAQLSALGGELRAAAPGALVAIDEEGGEVTRLHYLEGAPYPGAAILGRIGDLSYTEEIGRRVGGDILASGFNLALAPDADVNSNPRNPVIGTRSFGEDPATVAQHVAAWVRGLRGTGARACPKHFPGHGDTAQDSHLALPVVDAEPAVVEARDLPPFAAAVAAGAEAIMTSHILLPRLDPEAPATFSRPILQGLLRERLGFEGAIVSDALDMRGASGGIGIPEAAVRALVAGCDLLCLGTDTTFEQLREIEEHVLAAVREGRLAEARVLEAAERVRSLAGSGSRETSAAQSPAAPSAEEVARIVASFDGVAAARDWLRAHPASTVLRVDAEVNMAVGFAPWGPFAAAAHPLPHQRAAARAFSERVSARVDASSPMPWPLRSDAWNGLIVIGRELHRHEFARDGVDALREAGIPVLLVETGWPEAPEAGRRRYADVACYGSSALAGAALLELLRQSEPGEAGDAPEPGGAPDGGAA